MEGESTGERLNPEPAHGPSSSPRTSDLYRVKSNLPTRFNHPESFRGYSKKTVHPLYRTTNQTYGSKKPTVHEMPTNFHGRSRKFSEQTLKSGMYKDNGFNTSGEKSPITGPNTTAIAQDRITLHRSFLLPEGNQQTAAEMSKGCRLQTVTATKSE